MRSRDEVASSRESVESHPIASAVPSAPSDIAFSVVPLWARQVLNLRPLACEASALPLSYAPVGRAAYHRRNRLRT
jgi:hypothetical protein